MRIQHRLLTTTSLILFAHGVGLAQEVSQQPPVADERPTMTDESLIIVTARRREESLQEVPLTVTAVSSRLMAETNANDGLALSALTPGFTFETLGTSQQAKPVIRGVTTNALSPSAQLNSSFIDGAFVSGTPAPAPFIDLQRVEVLKGPQSTAFGRSTFTGAINYVTRDPSATPEVIVEALSATEGTYEFSGLVSGPVAGEALTGYIAGAFLASDGNDEWRNSDGTKLGDRKTKFFASKLLFRPGGSFEARVRYSYLEFDEGPDTVIFAGNAVSEAGGFGANQRTTAYTTPSGRLNFYPTGTIGGSTQRYVRDFSQIPNPGTKIKKHRVHAEITADILGHTLSAYGAYGKEDTLSWPGDQDNRRCRAQSGFGGTGFCAASAQDYEDIQFEARLNSADENAFRYMVGFYYIDLDATNFSFQPNTGTYFLPQPREQIESYAPFASIEYDFTSRLTVGFEARYNFDNQVFTPYTQCLNLGFSNGCANRPEAFTGVPSAAATGVPTASDFKAFLYRVTADYKFSDDVLAYAIVSRGNQPGRINTNINPDGPLGQFALQEEGKLTNYEIGLKSNLFDRRLMFNLALYNMDIDGYPQRITVEDPAFPGTAIAIFADRGKVRVRGVELESSYSPNDYLNVRGSLAYTDATFRDFCSNNLFLLTGVDDTAATTSDECAFVNGNKLEAQPTWDASLTARLSVPTGDRSGLFIQPEFYYQSSKYASEMNLAKTPDMTLFNLRMGYQIDNVMFELFGTNLTNERSPVRISRLTAFDLANDPGGSRQTVAFVPRQDRRFGARIRYTLN
jgi:iron complex outermembrane receptor protein